MDKKDEDTHPKVSFILFIFWNINYNMGRKQLVNAMSIPPKNRHRSPRYSK